MNPLAKMEISNEGMRSSFLGRSLYMMGKVLRLKRRRRLVTTMISLIVRSEGGQCFSTTARKIMQEWYDVTIGSYSYGSMFIPGMFPGRTEFGRYCSVAADARSVERNHPYSRISTSSFFYDPGLGVVDHDSLPSYEPLVVGNDVWIGLHAVLLPGCRRVGNGAILGAGAVVTKPVEDFAIVGGNPAKTIKYRFATKEISQLNQLAWWKQSPSQLRSHRETFLHDFPGE